MTVDMPPHRIDVHHHIIPPRFKASERERIVAIEPHYSNQMFDWTPERSIEVMDAAGVEMAITSLSIPGAWYGDVEASRLIVRDSNDYAAQMARDHRGRFGVFATLALPDVDGCLREIDYAYDKLRVDGFGILSNYDDKWPGDPAFAPIFDELNRRHAVVYLHPIVPHCCSNLMPDVASATLEFPFDTTRAIISLLYSGTFSRCRNMRFVFAHAGGTLPMIAHRIARQTI